MKSKKKRVSGNHIKQRPPGVWGLWPANPHTYLCHDKILVVFCTGAITASENNFWLTMQNSMRKLGHGIYKWEWDEHAIVFSNSNSYFILTREGLQPMFKLGSRNTDCKCITGKATRHRLESSILLTYNPQILVATLVGLHMNCMKKFKPGKIQS